MVSHVPSRRPLATSRIAASLLAASLLAACTSDGPTSPTRVGAPLLKKGEATGVVTFNPPPPPVPAGPGPLSGTWSGTLTYPSPLAAPYQVSLTVVQTGTGISGTFVQFVPAGDRDATLDAAGAAVGGQVSLTLRPQKGKPGAQSTSYLGTLSTDSSTITLRGATSETVIVLTR